MPLTFSRFSELQIWGFSRLEKLAIQTHAIEFRSSKRKEPMHRALFIITQALFAIIRCFSLWGFKTPAIYSLFFKTSEEEGWLSSRGWLIQKFGARFLALCHLRLFSIILIMFYYNNKENQWLRWLVRLLAGVGTWVRFPGPLVYFMIFSLTYSYAVCHPMVHHAASPSSLPCAQKPPSNGQVTHSTIHPQSTICRRAGKVKGALIQWAKNAPNKPLNWVKPPMFAFSFSLFCSFLLFVFIILIVYLIP